MSQRPLPAWADPGSPYYEPLHPANCPPMTPPPGTPPPADDRPRVPAWADADDPAYDPLLALGWPDLTPPPGDGPPRREWDATLKLLTAAANALLAARPSHVSTSALASKLGVSVGTVRRWVRERKVAAMKVGVKSQSRLFIPISEVDRLTAGRPLPYDPLSPDQLGGEP